MNGSSKRDRSPASYIFVVTLFLGLAALPRGWQDPINLGSIRLYPFELGLALACAFSAPRLIRALNRLPAVFAFIIAIAAAVPAFLLTGNILTAVLTDSRGLIVMGATVALVAALASNPQERTLLVWALKWLLLFSAAMVLLSSLTGFELSGRIDEAGLYLATGSLQTSSATRLLVPTSHLATGVFTAALSAIVLKLTTMRVAWPVDAFVRGHLVSLLLPECRVGGRRCVDRWIADSWTAAVAKGCGQDRRSHSDGRDLHTHLHCLGP